MKFLTQLQQSILSNIDNAVSRASSDRFFKQMGALIMQMEYKKCLQITFVRMLRLSPSQWSVVLLLAPDSKLPF